jgi:hypothetical protein
MPRGRIAIGAALAALALGALGWGVVSPVSTTDPDWMLAWKLSTKKLTAQAVTFVTSLVDPGALRAAGPATPLEGPGFRYEDLAHPELARIRSDPRLRDLYATTPVDVEEAVAMADFLRDQFPRGRPRTSPDERNVLELLDGAAAGEQFLCDHIARMLAQLVQAGGTQARRVRAFRHVVTEIWSRRWQKWVVVDPHFNIHFTDRGGVPLSALDLHRLGRADRRAEIRILPGRSANTLYRPERFDNAIDRYQGGFAVDFDARWFSNPLPRWHPRRSPSLTAVFFSEKGAAGSEHRYYQRVVDAPDVLYAPPDDARRAGATPGSPSP